MNLHIGRYIYSLLFPSSGAARTIRIPPPVSYKPSAFAIDAAGTLPRPSTGAYLRDKGMAMSAARHRYALRIARLGALRAARSKPDRTACIDDAYEWLKSSAGIPADGLGNAAGSVFKDGQWEFTGAWVPSRRDTNRHRFVRVWRLRDPA